MTYQVLARTWRPQRFDDLLGQESVVRTLQNAIDASTLGHAYLFSGLRGVGKTTAARLLAKAVNCVRGPTARPCGECISCIEISVGSSIDVVELDAATHTGVDDVRDLQELLRFRPARDRFRVVIVDEVHMLSKSAFNALLKSIEEPPPYVLWVFATTERHRVPATILSRCQQLEFRPVAADLISRRLPDIAASERFDLDPAAAETIARAAEGSVRDGLSLLDQLRAFADGRIDDEAVATVLGVPRFEVTFRLVEALAEGDAAGGLALVRGELAAGRDVAVLYQEVGRVLRHLVHLAVDAEVEGALTGEHRAMLEPLSARIGVDGLTRMIGLWLEQESLLRNATNTELALEVAALRLTRWPTVRRVEALLADDGGPETPPTPSAPETGRSPSGGASGERLAAALWPVHPRLAGAVEAAQVELADGCLMLRFDAGAGALARVVETADARRKLGEACAGIFGEVEDLRIEVSESGSGPETQRAELDATVRRDPQVQLAQKILGGEIVATRPDREVE